MMNQKSGKHSVYAAASKKCYFITKITCITDTYNFSYIIKMQKSKVLNAWQCYYKLRYIQCYCITQNESPEKTSLVRAKGFKINAVGKLYN